MFKKASETKPITRIVTLDSLGGDQNVKKGKVSFVPLFRVTDNGPGISLEDLRDGTFPWFKYQLRKKGDEPGKVKTVIVSWIDTHLRAGEDGATINDPGVTLGLSLPAGQRKPVMGFGVPALGFADPQAYRQTVRVPVLWNVEPNNDREGNVNERSGELVLLELKANQLAELVKQMKKVTKPGVNFTYYVGKEEKVQKYDYEGYGYAYVIDKDTSRKMNTYEWSKTDMTTSQEMWESKLDAAKAMFTDYVANAFKTGRPYESIIQECERGELDFPTAERTVVAIIAKKLLDAWGESYGDTTEDILVAFESVVPQYSYTMGAGISKVASNIVRVNIDEDGDETNEPF